MYKVYKVAPKSPLKNMKKGLDLNRLMIEK